MMLIWGFEIENNESYLIFTFLRIHINLSASHILSISEFISTHVLSTLEYNSNLFMGNFTTTLQSRHLSSANATALIFTLYSQSCSLPIHPVCGTKNVHILLSIFPHLLSNFPMPPEQVGTSPHGLISLCRFDLSHLSKLSWGHFSFTHCTSSNWLLFNISNIQSSSSGAWLILSSLHQFFSLSSVLPFRS